MTEHVSFLSLLFISNMNENETENEKLLDSSNNKILEEEEIDDSVVRMTKVVEGTRSGSASFFWRQNGMHFRGFPRQRSKKDPSIYTIHCFRKSSHKGKPCNFSFKAKCNYDRTSEEFFRAENWVVLSATKKVHLQISEDPLQACC